MPEQGIFAHGNLLVYGGIAIPVQFVTRIQGGVKREFLTLLSISALHESNLDAKGTVICTADRGSIWLEGCELVEAVETYHEAMANYAETMAGPFEDEEEEVLDEGESRTTDSL